MAQRRKRLVAPTNPLVAVAYLRVSTAEQHLGPEAQRAAIEAWAVREGVCVASWHLDKGVSGGSKLSERPGLLEAFRALRELGAGLLVVAKRDRLARDAWVSLSIERDVAGAGARIQAADGAGNGVTPEDKFMRTMLDGAAEHVRDVIRARTKAALAVKRARGQRTGSVPFGSRVAADGVHLEPLPSEQAVIRVVQGLRADGRSLAAIAGELAARGMVSRTGRPFLPTQVLRMLRA